MFAVSIDGVSVASHNLEMLAISISRDPVVKG